MSELRRRVEVLGKDCEDVDIGTTLDDVGVTEADVGVRNNNVGVAENDVTAIENNVVGITENDDVRCWVIDAVAKDDVSASKENVGATKDGGATGERPWSNVGRRWSVSGDKRSRATT